MLAPAHQMAAVIGLVGLGRERNCASVPVSQRNETTCQLLAADSLTRLLERDGACIKAIPLLNAASHAGP